MSDGLTLVCPSCGFYGPPDAYLAEGGAARGLLLALSVPAALAQPVQQYLRLFRPPKRALSSRRVVTLLEELLPMIVEARISRVGVTYPAPVEYWREALDEMVAGRDRLTLPLKSHGYLLTIIAGYAKKADAAQERSREERARGVTPIGGLPPARAVPAPPPPAGGKPRTKAGTAAGLNSLRQVLAGIPITNPAGDAGSTEDSHHE